MRPLGMRGSRSLTPGQGRPSSMQQVDVLTGRPMSESLSDSNLTGNWSEDESDERDRGRSLDEVDEFMARRRRKFRNPKRFSLSDVRSSLGHGNRSLSTADLSILKGVPGAELPMLKVDEGDSEGSDNEDDDTSLEEAMKRFQFQRDDGDEEDSEWSITDVKLVKGSAVWVRGSKMAVWQRGRVLAPPTESRVFVVTESEQSMNVLRSEAHLMNPTVEPDITALWHVHEPGILHNLHQRALSDLPYTFVGPVLVIVNPLKEVRTDPKLLPRPPKKGGESATPVPVTPHPFTIAEVACRQMSLSMSKLVNLKSKGSKRREASFQNQSILINGESGAGKTEAAKMVMRYLVKRNGVSSIDDKVIKSNPVLEAFGNARTLRNRNSSRFGKFVRLLYNKSGGSITGASISIYLLENSRVTAQEPGERNFHIFYNLLAGLPKSDRIAMGMDEDPSYYRYLVPKTKDMGTPGDPGFRGNSNSRWNRSRISKPKSKEESVSRLTSKDASGYKSIVKAMVVLGISVEERTHVFKILAGILHLGNVSFKSEDSSFGSVVRVDDTLMKGLSVVGKLFGMSPNQLATTFTKRTITVAGESVTKLLTADTANNSRDALAKLLYSRVFSWLVTKINRNLCAKTSKKRGELPFVGVLDIFGFESFQRNDFEQFLINFANESLQELFDTKIFQAELRLFEREGLLVPTDEFVNESSISRDCQRLLRGGLSSSGKSSPGIIQILNAESQLPKASGTKFNAALHRAFSSHANFPAVHPRDRLSCFRIVHYAGTVTYTATSFIEKNNGRVPKEVDVLFSGDDIGSVDEMTQEIWQVDTPDDDVVFRDPRDKRASVGHRRRLSSSSSWSITGAANSTLSVSRKFQIQMQDLTSTLGSTSCSFIRCIKPNSSMKRGKDDSWFDREYVSLQMNHLSITATANILKAGFPSRVPHKNLVKRYTSIFPADALVSWKKLGRGKYRTFVAALLFSFAVPQSEYKLGTTKVFFRIGMLGMLDKLVKMVKLKGSKVVDPNPKRIAERNMVLSRFRLYHARFRWRTAVVKVKCINRFKWRVRRSARRLEAATRIQAWLRGRKLRTRFKGMRVGAIEVQRRWRGQLGRKVLRQLRAEVIERTRKEREALEAKEKAAQKAATKAKQKTDTKQKAKDSSPVRVDSGDFPVKPVPTKSNSGLRSSTMTMVNQIASALGSGRQNHVEEEPDSEAKTSGGLHRGGSLSRGPFRSLISSVVRPSKGRRATLTDTSQENVKQDVSLTSLVEDVAQETQEEPAVVTGSPSKSQERPSSLTFFPKLGRKPSQNEVARTNRESPRRPSVKKKKKSLVSAVEAAIPKTKSSITLKGSEPDWVLVSEAISTMYKGGREDEDDESDGEDDVVEQSEVESLHAPSTSSAKPPVPNDSLGQEGGHPLSHRRTLSKPVLDLVEQHLTISERREQEHIKKQLDAVSQALQNQRSQEARTEWNRMTRRRRRRRVISLSQLKDLEHALLGSSSRLLTGSAEEGARPPLTGWAEKLSIKSRRNWRRRYLVLNREGRCISYLAQSTDRTAFAPELREVKGVFVLDRADSMPPPEVVVYNGPHRGRDHVLKLIGGRLLQQGESIRGPRDGAKADQRLSLMLSFDSKEVLETWAKELREVVKGVPGRPALQGRVQGSGNLNGTRGMGEGNLNGTRSTGKASLNGTRSTGKANLNGTRSTGKANLSRSKSTTALRRAKSEKLPKAKMRRTPSKAKLARSRSTTKLTQRPRLTKASSKRSGKLSGVLGSRGTLSRKLRLLGRRGGLSKMPARIVEEDSSDAEEEGRRRKESPTKDLVTVIETLSGLSEPEVTGEEALKQYYQLEGLVESKEIDPKTFHSLVPTVVIPSDGQEAEISPVAAAVANKLNPAGTIIRTNPQDGSQDRVVNAELRKYLTPRQRVAALNARSRSIATQVALQEYVQVTCSACGEVNNTIHGPLCFKCAYPLANASRNMAL